MALLVHLQKYKWKNVNLWAVTASSSYVSASGCVVACEASLGKAMATCEEVRGANMRGEKIMMIGLEQGNHHNVWNIV